jgi:superfamily II DNA/RNA helicase
MPFSELDLTPAIVKALILKGYEQPTPIQYAVIPPILSGHDLVGLAATGTGKTAAYALPLLQLIGSFTAEIPNALFGLILVPTRELAQQVSEEFTDLAKALPYRVRIVTAYGGVSINPQLLRLRQTAHIVIATPGRLLDLIEHNALSLSQIRVWVLDEADRLLDLGFTEELKRIQEQLPKVKQSLLFSATFSVSLESIIESQLINPLRIEIPKEPEHQNAITQHAIQVDGPTRTQLLRHLIETHFWSRVLVFVATRYSADTIARKLRKARIAAEPFHGDLSQGKRDQVLKDFKASRVKVVIATDVAARGLHIEALPVVVNYDLPRSVLDYTHRIGRTGRAGLSGVAISFVTAPSEAHFRMIEKHQGQTIPREEIEGFEPQEQSPINLAALSTQVGGGIKGKRPNKKDKQRALEAAQKP